MERELLITGIGGQGVQFGAQIVARAAIASGRHAMMFGSYGGMMRGGNTDATVVVGDGPIESPPTVTGAWSAIVMHPDYWPPVRARLRQDPVVVANGTVVPPDQLPPGTTVIPAGELAVRLGHPGSATLVALGAFTALTGLVPLTALCNALAEVLPAYRARHLERNERALRAGYDTVEPSTFPAWPDPVDRPSVVAG